MPSVTRLINKTAVKDYTLACIEAERPHLATKLTRISESYYVRVEARLRRIILCEMMDISSIGHTIK